MNPAAPSSDDDGLLHRLTARFLPDDFGDDPEQHFRARVVVALALLIGVVGNAYAVIVYLIAGHLPIVVATVLASTGVAITPWMMRRGLSFAVQGNWMTFCGCGLFVFVAYQEVLGPAVLLWQVVYVVVLALIAGRRSALIWLVLMSTATAYFYLDIFLAAPEEGIRVTPDEVLFEMILIVGMFVTVMLLLLASQRFKDWALNKVRRQEAHTRAILEAAPDGIVTLTNDARVGKFNAAAEELFDYGRDDVRQAPFTSLVPQIEKAPSRQNDTDEEASPTDSELFGDSPTAPDDDAGLDRWLGHTWEAEAVRRDGSRFPAEMSVTPIEDDEDRYVAILRDITERKKTQRALREARDRAVEANEAKSRFLANMSHELRTPLNAIIGYSELLTEDLEALDEPRLVDDVTKIEDAGNHLLSLINEILDLSKVEAGEMQVFVEDVDVQQLVDRVTSTIQPLIDDNDNRLKVDIDDAPSTMRVDRKKLRQILINLLSNASKFTEDGLIRIHGFTERRDGREFGVFEVVDRGIGIPEDKLQQLFEAFTQADESTTRNFGGTGLGLTICNEFTDLMCGDIDVESTVGEGSTFRVSLPVDVDDARRNRDTDDETDVEPTDDTDSDDESDIPDDAPRVLVVDDDPTVHQLMERFLRREGFSVTTSTGGADAVDKARELDPDIITLDVLMPEIDGWGMLERLKNDDELADIPVVMVTIVEDRNMGFSLGATEYLTKPIEPERLVDVLSSTLDDPSGPILIAEDDDHIRELLQRTVEDCGWEAVATADGRQALDYIDADGPRPAAILLDLMMPNLDGFEVLEELRDRPDDADIPVIVISAAELTAAEHEMLEQNTTRLFQKGDYAKEQLVDELESALQ